MPAVPITITETFTTPAGTADSGGAWIWPVVPLRFNDGSPTEGASKIRVDLVAGVLTADLTANDSPGLIDAGTFWLIHFDLTNPSDPLTNDPDWIFVLYAADASPVNLATRRISARSVAFSPVLDYVLRSDFLAHVQQIASNTVLGHIKSDEITLHVDQTTGVASVIGGGGSGHVIQDEGTNLPSEPRLNFVGAGVAATDNPGNASTDVTIPGGTATGAATPLSDSGIGVVGTGSAASHEDHQHPLDPAYFKIANNLSDGTPATMRTNLGLGTAATRDVPASGDASTTQVVKGDDTRLTNARPPAAHAPSHASAGSDPVSPASIGAAATANNLSDLANGATARTNLGLGNVVTLLGAVARLFISKAGTIIGTRRQINFVDSASVTWTLTDDNANEKVDVSAAAAGGGGGSLTVDEVDGTPSLAGVTELTVPNGMLGASSGTHATLSDIARLAVANTFTADQTLARAKSLIGTANDGTPGRMLRVDEATNETRLIDAASGGIRFMIAGEGGTYLYLTGSTIALPNQASVNGSGNAATDTSLVVHAPGSGIVRVALGTEMAPDVGSGYQVGVHVGTATPPSGRYGVLVDTFSGTSPRYGLLLAGNSLGLGPMTAPTWAPTGGATIYVDSADGHVKIHKAGGGADIDLG